MLSRKSMLVAGAVTTLGAASVIGLSTVAGATSNNTGQQSLVDKLSTRFSLNKDDVQKVFDEDRAAHEAEMEAKAEERLTQAVSDGKITEDQKTKILAKIQEIKSQMESDRDSFKNMTEYQRHETMENHHEELKKWAKDNDIPMEYLMFRHSVKGHGGPGATGTGEFHVRFDGSGGEKSLDVQSAPVPN